MNEARTQRLAYAAMLFNIIAWGMSWVSVRIVLTELDAGQVGAMRYLIASAVMLPSGFTVVVRCPTSRTLE